MPETLPTGPNPRIELLYVGCRENERGRPLCHLWYDLTGVANDGSPLKDEQARHQIYGSKKKGHTTPEPGVRLIRQHEVERFNQQMTDYRTELEDAVSTLNQHFDELKTAARRRLGDLFDTNDYPPSLRGLFGVEWDFPNIEPPDYLCQLNPAIYEQERARVASRFEEAVQLAEHAFVSEFAKLIEHLTERLNTDGTEDRKVFRNSAITNLSEFFQRFKQLNVSSNHDLDALVENARRIVEGVEPQELRDNNNLRQHIAAQLSGLQSVLDGMLVDRPRRRIIRNQTQGG